MKKIIYNADFITMEDAINDNEVEAIYIENGRIKKIGKKEEVLSLKDSSTELVDLSGKTVMPSFIDAHSHFFAVANDLSQINLNECNSINDIQKTILKYVQDNNLQENIWITANNYDYNNLIEGRNITKNELDKILPNNPIVIKNKSGHSGVINSKGLEILNISKDTISPEGGRIEKIDGKLTGYLEENAFIENIKKIPMSGEKEMLNNIKKAQEKYASYGITTVQEGYLAKELIPIYKMMVDKNILNLDVVAYIEAKTIDLIEKDFTENIKKYSNNFKIGGIKIFLDGSPQARTAWMRTPYLSNGEKYYGYGTMQDGEVEEAIEAAYKSDLQILAHCNGDKAAEQYINCIEKLEKTGEKIKKIRPVLIHGQLLDIDQLDKIKELGIIPSFFIAHVYHWGNVHIKNFGFERAERISPAGSSSKRNILYTFHQDSPVIEPNMFETIWCAVNRKTKDEKVLGENEKISVTDAIKAVTINAAYEYLEEKDKGSIKEGKLANLIIVDKNPLKIDKEKIKDIKVLETIKNGEIIYKHNKT